MSRARPSPAATTAPASAPTPARALIERQMAMLARLAEIGMEIAEAAGRRAAAGPEEAEAGAAAPDPALAFSRAARAVRLTIALQSRLMGELAALERGEALARMSAAHGLRGRAQRLVERVIEDHAEDEFEAERLSSDAWERLSEADDADLAGRSVAEVVAAICAELGLPADVAVACAGEALPGRAHATQPFWMEPAGGRAPAAIAATARAAPS